MFVPWVDHGLLQADDYMTQRQALRLLREMLLEPKYKEVSLMYSSNELFLQTVEPQNLEGPIKYKV